MHDRHTQQYNEVEKYPVDLEADTARWTSPAYDITFEHISDMGTQEYDNESFRVSARGLSDGLSQLLTDYSASQLRTSLDWLIISQNTRTMLMLGQAVENHNFDYAMIDQIFITIDSELFLPQGLRMHVACVTNIVHVNGDSNALDKFVAILDPGEVDHYIRERRGMARNSTQQKIH